jgi:hypothetical protein
LNWKNGYWDNKKLVTIQELKRHWQDLLETKCNMACRGHRETLSSDATQLRKCYGYGETVI